jgi:hypothetical protein
MISLNDAQLKIVMQAASGLPPEKRTLLLERIGASPSLRLHRRFSDTDLADVVQQALRGLVHEPVGNFRR